LKRKKSSGLINIISYAMLIEEQAPGTPLYIPVILRNTKNQESGSSKSYQMLC